MARKRRAVECVSYLDEDPYEEADERSLMIDLNADSDKGASKQNKNKQIGAGVKNGLNGVQSNANEVERLRTQLTEERREHRRALFDIRALIDRHIAKVGFTQKDSIAVSLSVIVNIGCWTNTVSEQNIPIKILILKQGPCLYTKGK